ncbi:DUF370 domain-containing protein [Fictibacillus sp. KIGAM418]|uniref:DUF370 domain-containing protein n=1 Tax=Fictibacillus marinisediminis TaxID=2878389 RepID=A0A9X1X714_9BACL|nr:extracellular matrix/biofilm biosynthesis regulator RemA family protein [Fictibacillus marinisediminis]MCK6255081.1 DUF370 domain-containing protein [Fictibacillus marinisediminis]
MLLHIGEEAVIQQKDIIAILDYHALESSELMNAFLRQHKEKKSMVNLCDTNPKSVIITKKQVYISPLSSITLKKRAGERIDFAHSWYLK